ncbi:SBBP repeat-containing protein [Spirosoma sp. BT702]|uniref:SBBP repeat-containing protein n=1 Tax=Spirosoma profusum TaxID=2771354 RepID=A0A926Y1V0_9BACT|nr:SBBP repeat-containing protein [Spirosoma profusum]MBD2704566.1 SBBP repeat-containing protein [Spirosoma profusum]
MSIKLNWFEKLQNFSYLLFLVLASLSFSASVQGQNLIWAKKMGGTTRDYGNAVTIDGSGNVYTTGYFEGTADFDPGPNVANLTSAGFTDIFISKLDASGNFLWAKRIGGTGEDQGKAIAADRFGNVHITGHFVGTVDFDPGTGTTNFNSAGYDDIFISKLDGSGNLIWARQIGGSLEDNGLSIDVDVAGNVYTTGRFASTVDFNPALSVANLTSAGVSDIFVSKLDASGQYVWAKRMGGPSGDVGRSLALGSNGEILLTGHFNETADFDPGPGTFNLNSAGNSDIFISKLDASGNLVWAKRTGGSDFDFGISLVYRSGYIFTVGQFEGTMDADPYILGLFNLTSLGEDDIVLSKLDESGNLIWAKRFGGTGFDYGSSVAIDGLGEVYLAGYFENTVDFDPGAGVTNLTSAGLRDIFVVKLDAPGNFIWARRMGGTSHDECFSMVVDALGTAFLTGQFAATSDFDPSSNVANLTSAGIYDVFVLKLSGNPVSVQSGSWTNPATWSCTCIPTVTDVVFLRNTVNLPDGSSQPVRRLIYSNTGRLIFGAGSTLQASN